MAKVEFYNIRGETETTDLSKHGTFAYNADCMEFLRNCPDKAFDLAIVDPPYGDGSQFVNVEREREREMRGGHADWESKPRSRFGGRFDKYHFCESDGRDVGNEIPSRGYL